MAVDLSECSHLDADGLCTCQAAPRWLVESADAGGEHWPVCAGHLGELVEDAAEFYASPFAVWSLVEWGRRRLGDLPEFTPAGGP